MATGTLNCASAGLHWVLLAILLPLAGSSLSRRQRTELDKIRAAAKNALALTRFKRYYMEERSFVTLTGGGATIKANSGLLITNC
jgi:hypothetical protein